jgi:four helix bundle protein
MTLEIYPVALELVRRVSLLLPGLRTRSSALADQLERALISVPLNLAEGAYSGGRNRRARYQTAAGSAREALACLETAQAFGWAEASDAELVALFNRVIGTLVRLTRPRT